MPEEIPFFNYENGTFVDVKVLKKSDISKCPKVIFLPQHYREDGSCRCSEATCEATEVICTRPKHAEEIYCIQHCREYYGPDYMEEESEDWTICPYCKEPLDMNSDHVRSARLDEPVHRDCMIDADDGSI